MVEQNAEEGNDAADVAATEGNDNKNQEKVNEENNEDNAVPNCHVPTSSDTTNFSRFNVKTEIDVVEHITEASILPNVTLDNQNILMNAKLR